MRSSSVAPTSYSVDHTPGTSCDVPSPPFDAFDTKGLETEPGTDCDFIVFARGLVDEGGSLRRLAMNGRLSSLGVKDSVVGATA